MRCWILHGSQQTPVFLRSNREPVAHFHARVWYTQGMTRKGYLSDVSDDEWVFVEPYLTLMREDAPQREHPLREVFNGLRYIVHTGMQWRMKPHDLPPWHMVYQQMQRWLKAGVLGDMAHDLRMLRRTASACKSSNCRRPSMASCCCRAAGS